VHDCFDYPSDRIRSTSLSRSLDFYAHPTAKRILKIPMASRYSDPPWLLGHWGERVKGACASSGILAIVGSLQLRETWHFIAVADLGEVHDT